ncbi:MAG: sigma 54-interacting transcriptional regulator [Myxococcales bacterium]|nr:sigma 54-interacting transcriptional regulator [Myxococcales bacterium]
MTSAAAPPPETVEFGSDRALAVRGFLLEVVEGAKPRSVRSTGGQCAIGSHPCNGLVVDDPTVSRFHCELVGDARGVRVRDLGSKNGTILDGVRVHDAEPKDGSLLRLGRAVVRVALSAETQALKLSPRRTFGGLVGESPPLRAAFALLERAAATTATVLLDGETGTGKGAMAEAVHAESARRDRPFVVVDCAALSPTLLDSELFGPERGAFTGAERARIGAFEEADGGTLFLDEIGELPLELQPKLLRVLESREIRRLGQDTRRPVDLRLIAATNRDLRAEVNAGRFRADLYYRLAVVKITAPPLRARPEDLPTIVGAILASLGAGADEVAAITAPEMMARMAGSAWPGNVRELRNYLERSLPGRRR